MDDRTRSLRSLVIERPPPAGPSSRRQRWLLPAVGILLSLLVLGSGAVLWLGGSSPSAEAPAAEVPSTQIAQPEHPAQPAAPSAGSLIASGYVVARREPAPRLKQK